MAENGTLTLSNNNKSYNSQMYDNASEVSIPYLKLDKGNNTRYIKLNTNGDIPLNFISGNTTLKPMSTYTFFTVSIQQPSNGKIIVNGSSTSTSLKFLKGTKITIEAIANEGYKVDGLQIE